jgi:Asp-tRNA(Asn)/Glu-tRNA(Gln) amidotransferase B subunit
MFYCGFYSVDVAVAFLNHFLTVGRHDGVNVCRIKTTIKCDVNVSSTPPFLQGYLVRAMKVDFYRFSIHCSSRVYHSPLPRVLRK